MFGVVSARESDVVWEENASSNVLISVDSVSGEEGLDLVALAIVSLDVNSVVEFVGKLFPSVVGSTGIDLFLLVFLHVVEKDKIAVFVRTSIASYQQ